MTSNRTPWTHTGLLGIGGCFDLRLIISWARQMRPTPGEFSSFDQKLCQRSTFSGNFWEPCLGWFLVRIPSDGVQRWKTPLCLAKGNHGKMHNSPAIDMQTDIFRDNSEIYICSTRTYDMLVQTDVHWHAIFPGYKKHKNHWNSSSTTCIARHESLWVSNMCKNAKCICLAFTSSASAPMSLDQTTSWQISMWDVIHCESLLKILWVFQAAPPAVVLALPPERQVPCTQANRWDCFV